MTLPGVHLIGVPTPVDGSLSDNMDLRTGDILRISDNGWRAPGFGNYNDIRDI
jgi:hypothetical protein